jgi:cytidine deaminase
MTDSPRLTAAQSDLLDAAREAARGAYAPYSNFRVGAAVLANGRTITGCNIENASANLGICAERVAMARAWAEGARDIEGVAVWCLDAPEGADGLAPLELAIPCGACRQWLAELAPEAWVVTNGSARSFALADLLPAAFTLRKPQ